MLIPNISPVSGAARMQLSQRGMSMIELLITVTILAIMMMAAVPAYTAWVQNTQIRTAAESIKNGLQLARTEAIQTNQLVRFAMTTNSGWKVNPADDPDKDPPIAEKIHEEGTPNVTIALAPAASIEVVFDAFGKVVTPPAPLTALRISNPVIVDPDERRDLIIVISASGSARMCDPKVLNPDDTRRCPLPLPI
jgi:type IV fimbrial biogenesis protein FimT